MNYIRQRKLRIKMGIGPGSEFIAVVKGEELHLKKLKTIVDVLDENATGIISGYDLCHAILYLDIDVKGFSRALYMSCKGLIFSIELFLHNRLLLEIC